MIDPSKNSLDGTFKLEGCNNFFLCYNIVTALVIVLSRLVKYRVHINY
jgi:hypothetical protein